jgi:hypothetical protein
MCLGDDRGKRECRKASQWHLDKAGISDPHAFKRDWLGPSAQISRFDICACNDGSLVIKSVGQCGHSDPGEIDTGHTWKN